jgi:hypothetical protein
MMNDEEENGRFKKNLVYLSERTVVTCQQDVAKHVMSEISSYNTSYKFVSYTTPLHHTTAASRPRL